MAQASARKTTTAVAGGSVLESIVAVGAIVLAILGLTQILPETMAAIGTIVIGAGLFLEGGILGGRAAVSTPETAFMGRRPRMQLGGAASAEVIGGAAGVVLGILVLLGGPVVGLLGSAVIVFGGALLVSGIGTPAMATLTAAETFEPGADKKMQEAGQTASGAQILVGLGAVTLGILALLDINSLVLILVALLAVGAALLINSAALGSMATYARQH